MTEKSSKKKTNIAIGLFIVAVVAGFFALKQCSHKKSFTPADKAKYANIRLKQYVSGILTAEKEVKIKSQISGILKTLHYHSGDTINKGDLIAEVSILPNPQNIESAQNTLKRCRINFEQSEKEFLRHKKLYEQEVIPEQEFEKYNDNYKLSKEELNSATKQLHIIQKGYAEDQKNIPNFIRSTVGGTILETPVKEGSTVTERNNFSEGTTLATVADLQSLIFKASITEGYVAMMKKGMQFYISINALKSKKLKATLTHINPKGFEENGIMKFDIEAKVKNNTDLQLYPGFSAVAEMTLDKRDSVLTIKERNLIFDKDSVYVELLDKDYNKKKTKVKTGLSDGIRIEIVEGLKKGDKIKVQ